MGLLCEIYRVGKAEAPPEMMDERDVVVDLSVALGGSLTLPLAATAAPTVRSIIDQTVVYFVRQRSVSEWSGNVRAFILKRVARIGEEASRIAIAAGAHEISHENLRSAVDQVIASTRAAESRRGELAA